MHENREISSAPWSDDQGRSAKATSRTADMHVLEKPQPGRADAVGTSYPSPEPVDSSAPRPAPLS